IRHTPFVSPRIRAGRHVLPTTLRPRCRATATQPCGWRPTTSIPTQLTSHNLTWLRSWLCLGPAFRPTTKEFSAPTTTSLPAARLPRSSEFLHPLLQSAHNLPQRFSFQNPPAEAK